MSESTGISDKCAICGKVMGYHKAHTLNCPKGTKSRIGYTQYHPTNTFKRKPTSLLQFISDSPFLAFVLCYLLAGTVFRILNIRKHGWPPAHCDADGDFKQEETP